jgi:hypothetical protein
MVRTGDAILDELGGVADVTLVKIDVEGYEPQVLQGLSRVLRQRPLIVFEALDEEALRSSVTHLRGYSVRLLEGRNFLASPD